MKRISGFVLILALFALPLLAAKNSRTFDLPSDVRVGDTQLKQGRCEVSWTEAAGTQVQLTIKTPAKTITVTANKVEAQQGRYGTVLSGGEGVPYLRGFVTPKFRFVIPDAADGGK